MKSCQEVIEQNKKMKELLTRSLQYWSMYMPAQFRKEIQEAIKES